MAEVNDVAHLVPAVDEADVAADDDVAVAARWNREQAHEVERHRMNALAPAAIQHESHVQPQFHVVRESVALAEAKGQGLMMTGVPVAGDLTVVVIEMVVLDNGIVPCLGAPLLGGRLSGGAKREGGHRAGCRSTDEGSWVRLRIHPD